MVMPHNKLDAGCTQTALPQHDSVWDTYSRLIARERGSLTKVVGFVGPFTGFGSSLKSVFLCSQPVLFSDQAILKGLRQRLVAMRLRWDRLGQSPRKQNLLSRLQQPGSQLGYIKQSSRRALLRWFSKGESIYDENWFLKYKATRYHYEQLLTQEPGVKGLLEQLLLPVPVSGG
ncbi:MAG: hypothetical protein HY711_01905, partial [Candidatus Melainabacteria bacterium]|nr:hypothetical protein [Candidatus Melainabacteria bacterium]